MLCGLKINLVVIKLWIEVICKREAKKETLKVNHQERVTAYKISLGKGSLVILPDSSI